MLTLSRNWWVPLVRGIAAILFALATFASPAITLATLILLFSAYAFIDGLMNVVAAFGAGSGKWWSLLLAGLFGIAVGTATYLFPGLTTLSLVYYIAFWAIASGVAQILAAIRLRKEIEGELWMALGGLLTVVFGIILIAAPGAGALGMLTVIAAYAFVAGISLILLAFKLRSFGKRMAQPATA